MRHVLIGFATLVAASVAGVAPSNAQHWQGHGTWCTQPPSGAWGCYYYSLAQCRATTMYGPDNCVPNPGPEWVRRGFKIPTEIMPRSR
jgi:hypothetical protein